MTEQTASSAFEGKVCTVSLEEEIETAREVRAAIGADRRLTLDANGGWTVPTAREAIRRLDPFEIFDDEDPVETQEELAQLRGHTSASFSTHVIDLGKTLALGVPDAIVTNLNELGGIRRTVEFIAACANFDVVFRFHSGETGIATAAYLGVLRRDRARARAEPDARAVVRDDVIEGGPFSPERGALPGAHGPGHRRHARSRGAPPLPRALPARRAARAVVPGRGYGASFRRR